MFDQTLAPPATFHDSLPQVSLPSSPGCGIVWKIHFNSPVRTSNPRTWPGGASCRPVPSVIAEPTTTVVPTTTGGELTAY